MADGSVDELYEDFGISRPGVEISETPLNPGLSDQQLTDFLTELSGILSEVERLKRLCHSPSDWQALMMYIAGQKPRVSEMTARAKRLYARQFGDAFDAAYAPRGERGSGVSAKSAEIRAKSEAGLAYEAAERLERSWRDLQDLMWASKAVAESAMAENVSAPSFEAYPEHLFPESSPDSDQP